MLHVPKGNKYKKKMDFSNSFRIDKVRTCIFEDN